VLAKRSEFFDEERPMRLHKGWGAERLGSRNRSISGLPPPSSGSSRPTLVEAAVGTLGLPIYVALAPVDMRLGAERLGALMRERMGAEPRSRAGFVFVGKRGQSMKVLTWDGTGTIAIHKQLDAGRFELPRATAPSEQHLLISDAMFDVIHQGARSRRAPPARVH
jgi:transposase